ncbi:hypothetical protein A5893_02435 [Pedobacter psychrophilus]|uniref:Uncharacterized protein n=1 Tax=Pedobacter psychrophilus TaxID=1826909 RepID=A0A179DM69_9SPHI|nr:glycoside hydrolase family 31 protein [Pedobacter psychrophilus]OAQ41998.1 hypothetical protein A5893_02435 [Pedobacter psychrophilus]
MKIANFNTYQIILLILILNISALKAQNNPISNPSSVIKVDNARFTVLTSGLIRMEWDSLGVFEDEATQVVLNRNLDKPDFKVKNSGKRLIIETDKFELIYKKSNERFNPKNLEIKAVKGDFKWDLSVKNLGNLKGTAKTLDNFNGEFADADHSKKLELEDGLLSTDGWFLLDDSQSYLLDNSELPWVKNRKFGHSQDFYFFCYGSDYKKAIYDYILIAGKVPLPPRFAFGYWWSRYYAYSDQDLRKMVADFESNQIPLDVLVIDMDWHPTKGAYDKNPRRDLSGSRRGWTGYTWDKRLFPDPEKFLKWTADKNLKVTLNLHPASGIPLAEEKYNVFAKAMDFDTTGLSARKTEVDNEFAKWDVFGEVSYKDIPYDGDNKKYMNNLFDVILNPLEKQGVDFWWLDWQQFKFSKNFSHLDNTWWLNHVFFLKMQEQKSSRPLIYHRWGGFGNHRYQIGFSGDAVISWESLAFEPYFTATASNVLYGYWSHDIGGHLSSRDTSVDKTLSTNPELYTRWLQYGVFSPILRTHSTTGIKMSRLPWDFDTKYAEVLSQYINLRYELAPYIYTMARKTYDTGISLCRPLYYDYPNQKISYNNKTEYLFGDDLLIAPITSPTKASVSTKKVWLPKGDWVAWFGGEKLSGEQDLQKHFALDEYPVYVKAGSVIPTYPKINNLKHNCDTLILKVFGRGDTKSSFYEDGGDDENYKTGAFAVREFQTFADDKSSQKLQISANKGSFNGMSSSKTFMIDFKGLAMPKSITLNGELLSKVSSENKSERNWEYLIDEVAVRLNIPDVKSAEKLDIEVKYDINPDEINGLEGKMKKAKKTLNLLRTMISIDLIPQKFFDLGELELNLKYQPENYNALVRDFLSGYEKINSSIEEFGISIENKKMLKAIVDN